MKISPVKGTPTIPQSPSTGLTPEKLQKIKSIAMGQVKEEAPHEEAVTQGEIAPPSEKVLKMQTNRNPEPLSAPQETPEPKAEGTEITQENANSDAVVQTKPTPEATQQVSPQIAALAKEKRALQVKERELAEREKALETKNTGRAELEQRVKAGQALSVLQDLGITYDQLTNELLGQQNAPDLTKFQDELLKKIDERFASNDAQQEENVFNHMKKNVDKLVYSSDDYPFVKAAKAQDKVLELIKRSWKENGEVLDEEEALKSIDDELKEEARVYAKLLKEPEPTTQDAAEPSPTQPAKTQGVPAVKTLTNKDSARPQSNRRQRALAAFLGQK